ncbi:hypothetical protein Tco_0733127 [Tanacetum coccineum]
MMKRIKPLMLVKPFKYSYNDDVSINRSIHRCSLSEEYSQEVHGFLDNSTSGIDDDDFDPEGDLLLLEKLLNDDPSSPLSLRKNFMLRNLKS